MRNKQTNINKYVETNQFKQTNGNIQIELKCANPFFFSGHCLLKHKIITKYYSGTQKTVE